MQPSTATILIELNRRFYADFGAQFSATRQRIQPGVRSLISRIASDENMLDLGCGNGEMAHSLSDYGFHGSYTGLDYSLPLLSHANHQQPTQFPVNFFEADLCSSNWDDQLEHSQYTLITSFALLHHIPDQTLRLQILNKVQKLLAPGGKFIQSTWQFMNSPKLASRVLPWETIHLTNADVDEGDYLLDWRSGGNGLRYVHLYSPQELDELAVRSGFAIRESFYSDGEGGRLGYYQTWERYENKR